MEPFDELIFEASQFRSEILKDIDQDFTLIKKDKKALAAKKELIKNIKEFSGVKNVIITFKKDYLNASIIPIYNQQFSLDLLNNFKDYENSGNIKSLEVAEEPAKYIKKLYIIFGNELIDSFSPRELTAILLHELGHSFTYTSNIPRILLALFQKGVGVVGMLFRVPVLWLFNLVTLPMYVVSSLIVITIARSLTFLEHKGEYRADQFAAKYGYADEIIKVLYKFHNKEEIVKAKEAWWEKIWVFIKELFSPSAHPNNSSRIEEVNDQMITEYKKLYPKLSNELSIILKDIKSNS